MSAERRVVIRTDAGADIGLGHLRRCLALARAFRAMGIETRFLVHAPDGGVPDTGFDTRLLAGARDLVETLAAARAKGVLAVVVDSYTVDTAYFRMLAEAGCRVVAIDDPADRELPVHVVVNPSATADRPRYRGAGHTRYLLGPRYAMLQPEFAAGVAPRASEHVRRVLLTLGGGDPGRLTARLISIIAAVVDAIPVDVVVGPWFAGDAALRALAAGSAGAIVLHDRPTDMRALMLAADVAVSGGGQTTFELAATGTPTVAIRLADNQTYTLKTLAEAGALVHVGDVDDPSLDAALASALDTLVKDGERRAEMSRRARAAVDGRGAARVAEAIVALEAAA
jgi:UDP-2,4-diacetamido-2,4,6-trideoxy-beta-L-altropyranose hydrolase